MTREEFREKYGIKATICLPDGAPISKVEATKKYGAEIWVFGIVFAQ